MEEYPIIWKPSVCGCIVMQCRYDPDNRYSFKSKCELHKELSDEVARLAIVTMCITETNKILAEQQGK